MPGSPSYLSEYMPTHKNTIEVSGYEKLWALYEPKLTSLKVHWNKYFQCLDMFILGQKSS